MKKQHTPNVQKVQLTSEQKSYAGELISAAIFYFVPLVATYVFLGQDSPAISPTLTGAIGAMISLMIAARIREIGSEKSGNLIAYLLFVLPIVPIMAFGLLIYPYWLIAF